MYTILAGFDPYHVYRLAVAVVFGVLAIIGVIKGIRTYLRLPKPVRATILTGALKGCYTVYIVLIASLSALALLLVILQFRLRLP